MDAYILIGGRSLRMGESKAALFLPRVAAAAREAFDNVFAVQRFGGVAVPDVVTLFEPQHDDEAPAFGVLAALEHARARCVVLAVDYPAVTPAILRELAQRTSTSRAAIVAPRWEGRLQMLFAGYDAASVAPQLALRLSAGRFDLRGLAGDLAIEEVELPPLRNVNTPEDLS